MLIYAMRKEIYYYVEGSFLLVWGRTSTKKINGGVFLLQKQHFVSFFDLMENPFGQYFFSGQYINRLISELIFSVSFGYFYKFKFESRLYRARFKKTSFVFRLGISRKVPYCLPLALRVKENRKRSARDYYTLSGTQRVLTLKTAMLFKSFRLPDMYSRLGIFIKGQRMTYREGIKRLRI